MALYQALVFLICKSPWIKASLKETEASRHSIIKKKNNVKLSVWLNFHFWIKECCTFWQISRNASVNPYLWWEKDFFQESKLKDSLLHTRQWKLWWDWDMVDLDALSQEKLIMGMKCRRRCCEHVLSLRTRSHTEYLYNSCSRCKWYTKILSPLKSRAWMDKFTLKLSTWRSWWVS